MIHATTPARKAQHPVMPRSARPPDSAAGRATLSRRVFRGCHRGGQAPCSPVPRCASETLSCGEDASVWATTQYRSVSRSKVSSARPTGPTSRSPRWIRESWCRGGRRRARIARGDDRVGDRFLRPGRARPAARPRSCAALDPVAARAGAARGPAGRHPRPRRLRRGPPGPPTRSTAGGAGSAGHPVAPGSRPRPAATPAPGRVMF